MPSAQQKISKNEMHGLIDEAFGESQELRLEEVIEHLLIRRAILLGMADAKAGRHMSFEEFDRRFRNGERVFDGFGNSGPASLLSKD